MLEKILLSDNSAFLGDEERKDESQGRYSPNLLGRLQVREAHMYVASFVLSVKVAYQYPHRTARKLSYKVDEHDTTCGRVNLSQRET
jgi:hypothetical protein